MSKFRLDAPARLIERLEGRPVKVGGMGRGWKPKLFPASPSVPLWLKRDKKRQRGEEEKHAAVQIQ